MFVLGLIHAILRLEGHLIAGEGDRERDILIKSQTF